MAVLWADAPDALTPLALTTGYEEEGGREGAVNHLQDQ
jgi:hypothetical protein